jgi:ABC-type branched-subunit amino acid transport system substrate-binding protein
MASIGAMSFVAGCNLVVGNAFDVTLVSDAGAMAPPLDPRCVVRGGDAGSPLRIGAILPMTLPDAGGVNPVGTYRLEAIELAFAQLNPPIRGGIDGKPLEVIVCDNSGDSTQAAALATSLIEQGVPAMIGATSSDVLQEATVTVPHHVLLMSSSATAAEISTLAANDSTTGVRMVWRTAPPDTFQGKVMARVLAGGVPDAGILAKDTADAGGPPVLGIFEVNSAYGQGLAAAIAADYPGQASDIGLYTENGDVSGALSTVSMGMPAPQELVAIAFPADAVNIANGAARLPSLASLHWFFSDSAKSPDLFLGLTNADAFEGALGTAPAPAPVTSPAYVWFESEFEATYMQDPSTLAFIPNTFDAAMLLAIAASWASSPGHTLDGPTMALALTQVSSPSGPLLALDPIDFDTATHDLAAGMAINVEGASGDLDFNPMSGEAPAAIEVWKVQNGGFTTIAVEQP